MATDSGRTDVQTDRGEMGNDALRAARASAALVRYAAEVGLPGDYPEILQDALEDLLADAFHLADSLESEVCEERWNGVDHAAEYKLAVSRNLDVERAFYVAQALYEEERRNQ